MLQYKPVYFKQINTASGYQYKVTKHRIIHSTIRVENRQTNFRIHTRQFRVVRSDIDRIKDDGEVDSHLYTFLLQEVIPQTK
jgi:adenine-specific DNA methylase